MGKAGPKNLSVSRSTENGGAALKASWGNPADRGYSLLDETWTFNASKNMAPKDKVTSQRGDAHATGDRIWVRDKGIHGNNTMWYARSRYHPLVAGRCLRSVTCRIHSQGKAYGLGYYAEATYTFRKPRKPAISAGAYNAQSGNVTFTVTTNAGTDAYERRDTMVRITRLDSPNRNNSYKKEQICTSERSTTSTSYNITVDVADALSIVPGQWIRLRCRAYARGLAGDSEMVYRDYYHAFPAVASIGNITASSKDINGILRVPFALSVTATAPVDEIVLQRLVDTPLATAAAAGGATGWSDVPGAVDNSNARGFSDSVMDAMPQAKNHTWYRVKTRHGSLVRYSMPVEAKCLYHAKDAGGAVSFVSMAAGDDGESLRVALGWATDNYSTTQVAWSEVEDAWESTDQPDDYEVDWEDATPVSGYAHSANLTIRRLKEGTPYYVRARRMAETDGVKSYGSWCFPGADLYPITTSQTPSEVILTAPESVPRDEGITLSWAITEGTQTAWKVLAIETVEVPVETEEETEPTETTTATYERELAGGDGPQATATIKVPDAAESIALVVSVTCGGDWVTSEQRMVVVRDAPQLTASIGVSIAAQPITLTLTSDDPNAAVTATLEAASMVAGDTPSGKSVQAEGDVVWSDVIEPSWAEDGTQGSLGYMATHTLPGGLDLREGATYRLIAAASSAGLRSGETSCEAPVTWAHQAVAPSEDSVIEVDGEALSCSITPVAPVGAAEGDSCDVYRVTLDGSYAIAEGVEFGTTVLDQYAPYAAPGGPDLSYRLCTRTADGDAEWVDVAYELASRAALRIDWDGGFVELPYNLSRQDSRSKSFSLSERWDGSRPGHWESGVTRTTRYSVSLVGGESWEDQRALAELAAHVGPCLVRTSAGQCFCADVQVEISEASDSVKVPVSLSVTECDMDPAYRASLVRDAEDNEGGEQAGGGGE